MVRGHPTKRRAWAAMCKHDAMTGLAKWMIELYDPTMDRLLDPDGTFKGCTDKHHKTRPDSDSGTGPSSPHPT
ncbi:DUF4913 domain-containing protein [Trueperella abortisuis]|uniref:DUF4913 domain-containing protein n=1 Tax=Trueperella abortisuis TaxID=445930 RepID=UPI0035DC752E